MNEREYKALKKYQDDEKSRIKGVIALEKRQEM